MRPYPGLSPAATPDLNKMMPDLNKMIQGQTGQQNDVVLNPAPRDVLKIVEAIDSKLCKIGVTCQDAVEYDEDGRMRTLGRLDLRRCCVYDSDSAMYNSLVYRRRPGGRKLDGIVLAVCTDLNQLNWAEDALSKGALGSVNAKLQVPRCAIAVLAAAGTA